MNGQSLAGVPGGELACTHRRMDRAFDIPMQRRLILMGAVVVWLLFVASFLMPVLRDKSMIGWEAFWYWMRQRRIRRREC